jgi:hypothetical protein
MRRRKIKGAADARACLAAVRSAGGDAVAWSRAHGVDARSLNAWRVNLGRCSKPVKVTDVALVELVPSAERVGTRARYVLDLGAARLEFDDLCSAETLRRAVTAVRAC